MEEYSSTEQQLETMKKARVKHGFFVDIDDGETLKKPFLSLLKYYRLHQVKRVLHGQSEINRIDNSLAKEAIKALDNYAINKI
ncbi:hypothetical protein [Agarilytica rhodophyticola]|uniref:hypothetical protein n=1 Tax=Agarilytica rhodophyticola TaxID=1737490 RepID=UPI000B340F21|nr:hypothetical protein [Agarilytica rhodophyticola]